MTDVLKHRRETVVPVVGGLTDLMFAAVDDQAIPLSASTRRGLEARGLLRRDVKGRWHWTGFARIVRKKARSGPRVQGGGRR